MVSPEPRPAGLPSEAGDAPPKFATVVLAGGEGRRMGGGKPLRMLAGATLLERALAFARSTSPHVAAAVRDEGQIEAGNATIITDDPDIDGPLGGLASALRYARQAGCEAVLTIPADMPFLPPDLAERLALALPGHCAAIAASGGHLHPVCGLWRVGAAGGLAGYIATGRLSLRGFAEVIGMASAEWSIVPFDPFFNINGPSDIEAAERLLAG